MPRLKTLTMAIWVLILFPSFIHAADCSPSGQSLLSEGWSKEIRRVCITSLVSANSFRSPDKAKVIVADDGGFHLTVNGKRLSWPEGEDLTVRGSEVSWSPQSSAFFINYGDGSGLDGWTLKVYSISDGRVVGLSKINQEIVRRFRVDEGCPSDAVDPNVRGLGWTENGADIYAFAQATVSQSCGQQGDFRGATVSLAKCSILSFYSEAETKAHFHRLLPYNMR